LVETTYHQKKIYVPTEVREKLRLSDGDKLNVEALDRKSFRVELKRKTAEEQTLDALANAREVSVPRELTRRKIYEKPLTPREAAELCMLYGKSVTIGKTRNTLKSTAL
jgi:AbrB family looped-hinge helix DNA binding protein